MKSAINSLLDKFEVIRNSGAHKTLRNGNTGIGFTFESLIGKREDAGFSPDYRGIEIKTKVGYSKCPITLFSLVPKSKYSKTIEKMVEMYGYPDKDCPQFKVLRAHAHSTRKYLIQHKYYYKLYVDWKNRKVRIHVFNLAGNMINGSFYWTFSDLEHRLCTKLNYLALVIGYPYRQKGEVYYKYFKIHIYKLKSFNCFLELIEKGIVSVIFNIGVYKTADKYGEIYDHGTAFKIDTKYINRLFDKLFSK